MIGVRRDGCAGSWRLTPHLTSPLPGGRDELGEGMGVGLAVGGKCEQALGVFAIPSFLRRQEFARSSALVRTTPPPHAQRQMSHTSAWVPACAGMTERGAGMARGSGWRGGCGVGDGVRRGRLGRGAGGWGAAWAVGVRGDGCAGSWRLTPHLTSPLEEGRDELGKESVWGLCWARRDYSRRARV